MSPKVMAMQTAKVKNFKIVTPRQLKKLEESL